MLKLARLIPAEPADITFGPHVPFAIEWPAHHPFIPPVRYWRISGDYELLQLGLDATTGALASLEHPARFRVSRAHGSLWSAKHVREGHPEFDLASFPTDEMYFDAPDVSTFPFSYSSEAIKLSWAEEATVVVDGRVRFGFDWAENLVAIGLDGLGEEEARIVDELVTEWARSRGRPLSP